MKKTLIMTSLFLGGCATKWTKNIQAKFDTWENATEEEILTTYGAPTREKTLDGGKKFYTYEKSQIKSTDCFTKGCSNSSYSVNCTINFMISEGQVVSSNWNGHLDICDYMIRSKSVTNAH